VLFICRYYAAKARHVPHVISFYTAGARLIGLNDYQLEQQIRRMRKQKNVKNENSPYARPLPFLSLEKQSKKKAKNIKKGLPTKPAAFSVDKSASTVKQKTVKSDPKVKRVNAVKPDDTTAHVRKPSYKDKDTESVVPVGPAPEDKDNTDDYPTPLPVEHPNNLKSDSEESLDVDDHDRSPQSSARRVAVTPLSSDVGDIKVWFLPFANGFAKGYWDSVHHLCVCVSVHCGHSRAQNTYPIITKFMSVSNLWL
jgi:hypothetical protein